MCLVDKNILTIDLPQFRCRLAGAYRLSDEVSWLLPAGSRSAVYGLTQPTKAFFFFCVFAGLLSSADAR